MARFSENYLRTLKPKDRIYKVSEEGVKGEGRLIVKVLTNGRREFYYRYREASTDKTIRIGRHQLKTNDGGITLAEAREKLGLLIKQHKTHGDIKVHRIQQADVTRREELQESRKGTLEQLLNGYIEKMRSSGKKSVSDVANMFNNHIIVPFPDLIKIKAKDIQAIDLVEVLARMVNKGITRRVNLMRACLHAAFAWGSKADHNPVRASKEAALFGINSNPVASIPIEADFEQVGTRNLSETELGKLWYALEKINSLPAKTLQVTLALGGQRLEQLTLSQWQDLDESKCILTLRDPKGNGAPRDHLLPLSDWVLQLLAEFKLANSDGKYIFSTTRGDIPVRTETLSHMINDISKKLQADEQIEPFRMGDLRRTTETLLGSLGVDLQTRAWLLSHGRNSGIQKKHYDQFEYLPQKTAALKKWHKFLSKVIMEQS